MTSVKRRINSTGRKRIPRERITVEMLPAEVSKPAAATVELDLDGFEFADGDKIVLEAYQRSTAMRFDLGTVVQPEYPERLVFSELDPGASILFRLKVVKAEEDEDDGKIVGAAERLKPSSDDNEDGRRSLFPIEVKDLGPEVWKLNDDLEDAGPRLLLNVAISGLIDTIKTNPLIQGIILPAALRIVLTQLAADPAFDENEEEPWKRDWLQYCRDELRLKNDPSDFTNDEDREYWINDAVAAFCRSGNFVDRIRKSRTGE